MRSPLSRSLALVGLFGVSTLPAYAAAPIGKLTGKVGAGNAMSSVQAVLGWALDDDGIAAVDVTVDGIVAGRALYGLAKVGISRQHPNFPDSALPGFMFQLDTTRYVNGTHVVAAVATTNSGEVTKLPGKSFTFYNGPATLLPFGETEFPKAHAELVGNCTIADPARRYSVVSGYALDTGVQARDTGVGFVELLIDRSLYSNTKVNCREVPAAGGLVDCYGLRRLDISGLYPLIKDSTHSGFRFVLDVGALLAGGIYLPGHHTLTIRVGDILGQTTNVAEIPVTFRCDEAIGNEGSIGDIDLPEPILALSGIVRVRGWALDWEGVHTITVLIDNALAGVATHGFLRPEVTGAYPGYPESLAPGFEMDLDTTNYSEGYHDLQVIVTDDLGVTTDIGQRRIKIRR
jgi:hypothetical protein